MPKISLRVFVSILSAVALVAGAWAGTRYSIESAKGDLSTLRVEVERINRDGTRRSIDWMEKTNNALGELKTGQVETRTEIKGLRETIDARFDALERRLDAQRSIRVQVPQYDANVVTPAVVKH